MFRVISFLVRFFTSNFNEFLAKNGPYMSAAIAFYAFFSLFPLTLAVIAVLSLVLGISGVNSHQLSWCDFAALPREDFQFHP